MASREPKAVQDLWRQAYMNHIEHVGHQRVIPGCSTGLTGLRKSLCDISPKGQTQERSETHAGQSSVLSSSAGLAGVW